MAARDVARRPEFKTNLDTNILRNIIYIIGLYIIAARYTPVDALWMEYAGECPSLLTAIRPSVDGHRAAASQRCRAITTDLLRVQTTASVEVG